MTSDRAHAVSGVSGSPTRRKPDVQVDRGATASIRPSAPSALNARWVCGSCQCCAVPLRTSPATTNGIVAGHQLGDRAAHRVADDERRRDAELPERGSGVAGAVRETKRRDLAHPAAVPAVVDREHPIAGTREVVVRAAPVEIRGRHPAMEQHDGRAVATAIPEEQLAAAGHRIVRAGGISIGGTGGQSAEGIPGDRTERARLIPSNAMAVVIASDLGKDIAGEPLLRGISFKLERRDRMTLSGRNGAGKTTLLRMLCGRGLDRRRRARARQGHQGRPARPAPAAGSRSDPARVRPDRRAGAGRDRGRARRAGAGDGAGRPRRGDAQPLRAGAGAPRARRRLRLARTRPVLAARPGLPRRRRSRPVARDLLAAAS